MCVCVCVWLCGRVAVLNNRTCASHTGWLSCAPSYCKSEPCVLCAPLSQARSYEEATNSVLGWYLRNAQTRALSHPLPVMRAKEIDRWAASPEYKALLLKNSQNKIKVRPTCTAHAYGVHLFE